MRFGALLVALVAALALRAPPAGAAELRLSSLAPEGSSWAREMRAASQTIAQRTQGRVTFKYFFGGSQGGEREVVRKMRDGRLEGGAVTAVGLGVIRSNVRVLELPFLFRNDAELDHVRSSMADRFVREFDESGYVLLAWGDLGWIHVFSNVPVKSSADFAKLKMWAWSEDSIVRTLLRRLGVAFVPLDVPDVLPALQQGTIDACYNAPLATLAFGWHNRVKYMTAEPIAYGVGAIVLTREAWATISKPDQAIVRQAMRDMEGRLSREVRASHQKAKRALARARIKTVPTPTAFLAELQRQSELSWGDLSGRLFPAELLAEVRKRIAEVRPQARRQ